jgi:hypothetical protein
VSARLAALLLALLGASGCRTEPVSARIVTETPAARQELESTIALALNRDSVPLAADALHADSVVIVEPVAWRDAQGRRVQGRETTVPDHFRLVVVDQQCWLVHEESRRRFRLTQVRCEAAPSSDGTAAGTP